MRRWTVQHVLIMLGFVAVLIFICALLSHAQTPVALSPVAKQQFFDSSGKPLAGGALFTFIAGTTTQQATYSESTGTVPNSNPIILDAGGFVQPGPIFLSGGSGYKFVLCAAFTGVAGTGTCALYGPQQWSIDNILLSPFLSGNNTFTGNNSFNGTTTFNGPVNMNGGGSLSGTFSGSPTFSGTPIFSGGMTVTGGTFTGPTLVSPVVSTTTIVPNLNPDRQSISVANNAGGTVLNEVVKLTGAPSTAVVTAVTDTGGAIGICTANCTNSGSATVQVNGLVSCVFDGATTAGDFVVLSATTIGNCHDVGGGGYPSSGQILGRSLSTNVGAGTYQIDEFPADIRAPSTVVTFPQVVYSTVSASTNTNIPTVTMLTPVGVGTYRFSFYGSLTVVGTSCTGSTTVNITLTFQDQAAAAPQTLSTGAEIIANGGNGTLGNWFGVQAMNGTNIQPVFRVKAGTAIQYSTTYALGTNCAPGPQYQIFPILEQLTSN